MASHAVGSIVKHPARASLFWYLGAIIIGSVLLSFPFCQSLEKPPISPLDAAFTATSATCVTGLAVRSTGNDFSLAGQVVILILIQLGGIGIMTVTTFITFSLGGRESLRHRAVLADSLGAGSEPNLRSVVGKVFRYTLLFEGAGFVILAARFLFDHSFGAAIWQALFHSVSAFCNAGFSLNDDSLVSYQGDVVVNATVSILIICGGIGFPVMVDIVRNREHKWPEFWERLTLHSKLMLSGTALLLALGTLAFLILEWDGALAEMSVTGKCVAAFFQSFSCRTAGFNTIEIGVLTNASLFIMILLMMIGAGPCSTGGGFKVSTLIVLVLRGWATFRGRARVVMARRSIPGETIDRAIATAMLFAVVAIAALAALLILEQSEKPHAQSQGLFLDAMFEVFSALGTVGLTTGVTPYLTDGGRLVIIALMLMGRLGPITVFAALARTERTVPVEYALEAPLIG
ncbi:MAG: TrkH family potassium uptake protein [Planctomycetales bacterium]|nr:TrkH family potassium uptake protein [Planctomycetales bacterium]